MRMMTPCSVVLIHRTRTRVQLLDLLVWRDLLGQCLLGADARTGAGTACTTACSKKSPNGEGDEDDDSMLSSADTSDSDKSDGVAEDLAVFSFLTCWCGATFLVSAFLVPMLERGPALPARPATPAAAAVVHLQQRQRESSAGAVDSKRRRLNPTCWCGATFLVSAFLVPMLERGPALPARLPAGVPGFKPAPVLYGPWYTEARYTGRQSCRQCRPPF
jgi:hypothetical protein